MDKYRWIGNSEEFNFRSYLKRLSKLFRVSYPGCMRLVVPGSCSITTCIVAVSLDPVAWGAAEKMSHAKTDSTFSRVDFIF